ncbi:hypothetical protein Salat_1846000 [Sesamum alatum]|uniref:Uncharacterized protein n=1 Tax=Sesamum alatum TaxID=300844 RepID=A0AAE1Y2L4_9LAMI|nr:hypothetical protein Salat_1846000 [Sesamum alatum]
MRRRVTREEGSAYLIRKVLERGTPTIPLNYKLARNGFSAVVAKPGCWMTSSSLWMDRVSIALIRDYGPFHFHTKKGRGMEERGLGNLLKERTQRMGIARRNWKQDIEATLGSEGGLFEKEPNLVFDGRRGDRLCFYDCLPSR